MTLGLLPPPREAGTDGQVQGTGNPVPMKKDARGVTCRVRYDCTDLSGSVPFLRHGNRLWRNSPTFPWLLRHRPVEGGGSHSLSL